MFSMRYLFALVVCPLFFMACQPEKIDMPDTGRKIVINGLITTDSLLNVFINKSGGIDVWGSVFRSDFKNANVYIYQNNICIDSLYHLYPLLHHIGNDSLFHYSDTLLSNQYVYSTGNYLSKHVIPLAGNEYKIVTKAPGLPDATASTKIPNIVKIENIDTSWSIATIGNSSYGLMTCHIDFTDPANETNYYLFNICKFPNFYVNYFYCLFLCDDPIVEEKLIENPYDLGEEGIVFSDRLINGKKYSLTVSYPDDRSELGWTYPGIKYKEFKEVVYFRLYSISEEYFKYIQTLNLYYAKIGNPIAEPVQVHSNIIGGYGILGGAAVSCDSLVVMRKQIIYQ